MCCSMQLKGKIPEELLAEDGICIRDLAPVIKSGGHVPDRAMAINCGELAALEEATGPPKAHLTMEAVETVRTKLVTQCSVKTSLSTGKFNPDLFTSTVPKTPAETRQVKVFVTAALLTEVLIPVTVFICLWKLPVVLSVIIIGLVGVITHLTDNALVRFPPAGRYSLLRSALLKEFGLHIVVEGKPDPTKPHLFLGVDHGPISQLLLASAAPATFGHPVRPTFLKPFPLPIFSPMLRGFLSLLGVPSQKMGAAAALERGDSASLEVKLPEVGKEKLLTPASTLPAVDAMDYLCKVPSAASLANSVVLAMQHGADVTPCVTILAKEEPAKEGLSKLTSLVAGHAVGRKIKGGVSTVIICCKPVRVPFTSNPPGEVVMEFAEGVRSTMLKAYKDHHL
ncbi:unnamed protein product [Choristocarpus tenellus]